MGSGTVDWPGAWTCNVVEPVDDGEGIPPVMGRQPRESHA